MRRKLSAMILAGSLVFGCTGCGSEPNQRKEAEQSWAEQDGTEEAESQEDVAQSASDGEKVITMWSVATEGRATANGVAKAIETYESNHPGVRIKHETFENEAYKTKIRTALAANEVPDIFFAWFGAWSEPFVDAEKVLNLDD